MWLREAQPIRFSYQKRALIKALASLGPVIDRARNRRRAACAAAECISSWKRVAADAEIGIELATRFACPRTREEVLDAPAVGEAHALGMTCRNRFERGLPHQRIEDLDERLVDKVSNRSPCLDAARVYVAGRLDGNL